MQTQTKNIIKILALALILASGVLVTMHMRGDKISEAPLIITEEMRASIERYKQRYVEREEELPLGWKLFWLTYWAAYYESAPLSPPSTIFAHHENKWINNTFTSLLVLERTDQSGLTLEERDYIHQIIALRRAFCNKIEAWDKKGDFDSFAAIELDKLNQLEWALAHSYPALAPPFVDFTSHARIQLRLVEGIPGLREKLKELKGGFGNFKYTEAELRILTPAFQQEIERVRGFINPSKVHTHNQPAP